MKPFVLTPKMRTLAGTFYPKGWIVAMVNPKDVQSLAERLAECAAVPDDILHLPPETVLKELGGAVGESDLPLPSVGTEGQSVRRYVQLAREGWHGLMVHAPTEADTERVMEVLRTVPLPYAQKYHRLAIEDLH